MPISPDDDNIVTKYYNKSMFGIGLSFLFFAIILALILIDAPLVGKQIKFTE
jgi:hypothetical protein